MGKDNAEPYSIIPFKEKDRWYLKLIYKYVAPVRHGRWIHYPDCGVTRCSHCGWSIEECWESKRCPDCGAKMDGGEDQ